VSPEPYRCPTCGKAVAADAPDRPFCSERCRMVDLGAWLLGHYRIPPREDLDEDAAEPAPGAAPPATPSPHGPDDASEPDAR
jgi:endogenous inhibitor of DNA gyrase (YacG/DUF329 family)